MKCLLAALLCLAGPAGAIPPPLPPPNPADPVMQRVVAAGDKYGLRANLTLTIAAGPDDASGYWGRETHGWLTTSGYTQGGGEGCNNCPGIWRYASVTKQIAAVLVMQEVEAGRVRLDAPIGSYLARERRTRLGRVTVRQLLQHVSGAVDAESGAKSVDGFPVRYLRTPGIVANDDLCHGPPSRPGTFHYNNCDYELAGEVLTAVTGKSFAELLEERIARPLQLNLHLAKPGDANGQPGYIDGKPDDWIDVGRFGAAAGVVGYWGDLILFDQALMDGRLLKAASLDELWRGEPRYGYAALGAWSFPAPLAGCSGPQRIIERRGEVGGVQVRNFILPERRIALTVFTARPADFGEIWQGKGLSYDLLSAAACPA